MLGAEVTMTDANLDFVFLRKGLDLIARPCLQTCLSGCSSNGSSTAYVRSSGGLGLDGGEQRVVSGGGLLLHHESTGLLNGSTGSTGGPAGLLTNGCNSLNVSPGGILARYLHLNVLPNLSNFKGLHKA